MTRTKYQLISALVDNESDEPLSSLVDRMLKDEEMRHTWQRYHEIGDWLRGAADGSVVKVDVANRVSGVIDKEPALFLPGGSTVGTGVSTQKRERRFDWWSQFAGVGIAAMVAAVTVLLVQGIGADPQLADQQLLAVQNPVRELSDPALSIAVATTGSTEAATEAQPATVLSEDELQQRLDAYLVSHVRQSSSQPVQGVLPFARVVDRRLMQQSSNGPAPSRGAAVPE